MFQLTLGETPATQTPQGPGLEHVDDNCRACGWFDSSHDLRQGLQVHEHTSLADVSALLPLADWLQLHGAAWERATLQNIPLWA